MIRITGLAHRILSIPDLAIPPGFTAVIGPNGGGKTTLLRLGAGLDLPEKGEILVDGQPPRLREVGWAGENPGDTLIFTRVRDEIASPLRFRRDPCPVVEGRVTAIAGKTGTGPLLDRGTGDLSAGEKARVALAAALATEPELLVLDEADAHLDQESTLVVEELVRASGCSHVLWSTHRMALASRADYLLFLEGGRVLHAGTPPVVFASLSGTPFLPPGWCR